MKNGYIAREDVLEAFYWQGVSGGGLVDSLIYNGIREVIRNTPSANVVPVVHGRWIVRGNVCGEREFECSVCHRTEWRSSISRFKFCPFCSAKMDLGRITFKRRGIRHYWKSPKSGAVYHVKRWVV